MIRVILIGAAVLAIATAHHESSKTKPKPVETCCGVNSHPGCGINCGKKCSDYPPGSKEVAFSCAEVCQVDGCDCDPGYVYDNFTKSCVEPDDCRIKAVTCTGANQVYQICPPPCPRRVCGIDDTLVDCIPSPQIGDADCAPPACTCRPGYYLNDQGDCVLLEDCPKCDGPNQIYDSCLFDCPPRRCDVDPRVIRCSAPPKPGDISCKAGCRCKDGYKKNADGFCIPETECPPFCNGNEIASNCTNGGCSGPKFCSERGQGIKCVKISEDQCKKGCLCKPPLVRNELTGDCVTEDQCPETPICEEENQVFDYCPAGCPPRLCGVDPSLILCLKPPELGDPECQPGCRCRDGYKKEKEDGKCIPEEKCQVNQCNKENEELVLCPSNCPPGVCGINDLAVTCALVPDSGETVCPPPACKCKFGFYRDNNGDCVRFEDCPKCDERPNEVYSACFTECGKGCNVDPRLIRCAAPQLGDPGCIAGCTCADGYKRNESGICVHESECQIFCNEKQEPDNCINGGCYSARNCSQIGRPEICIDLIEGACIRGCICVDGYLLNEGTGTCVPEKECPGQQQCTGINEIYVDCPDCSPQTCDSINETYQCPLQSIDSCIGQCRCKPGYFRNKIGGDCISKENCLKCTGKHEFYSCGGACDNVCATLSVQNQTSCPIINIKCNEMCYCEEGYARDDDGNCILIEKCPPPKGPICGPNEVPSDCINGGCFGARNCSQLGEPTKCVKLAEGACIKGCLCKDGYLRDDKTGKCVPEKECPAPICGDYEEFNECANGGCYSARLCSELGNPVVCVRPLICNQGCLCIEGYVRDDKTLKCIPEKDCPEQCRGENEIASNCINFGCIGARNCSEINRPILCIDPIDPSYCKKGCVCAEGYLRDDNSGDCVLREKCPGQQQCTGINEIYVDCPDCSPQTCDSINKKYHCPLRKKDNCKGRCRCKPGYYRNKIGGDCISKENCLKCTGKHEFYSCGGACDNVCATLSVQNQTSCPIINIKCNEMCYCEEGYARDDDGNCIPIEKCPPPKGPICGPNEVPSDCINGGCFGARNCSQLGEPTKCVKLAEGACIKGCLCKDGYLRDDKTGKCVPEKECPAPICGDYEEFNECANGGCYSARLCSELGNPVVCVRPLICNQGCLCIEGYVRDDKTLKCIPEKDCPEQCRGENEIASNCINFGCIGARNCSEINRPIICIDPIDPSYCKKGCVCADGYLRDDNSGDCVLREKCPDPICNANEELSECSNGGCWDARYCSEVGNPTVCARPQYCIKGCLCKEGYVRDDDTGKCIPKDQCPGLCLKDNEVASNCINFGCIGARNCSEINRPILCIDPIDPSYCKKGCVCADGYLRDDNSGECVLREKCPDPICKENEELNECANGGCWDARYCSEIGNPTVCARPQYCIKGCLCKAGYVRDDDTGKCVPKKECPNLCPGKNQYFDECPPSCSPQTCQNVTTDCIEECECKPACRCKDGYLRNNDDECVPKEDCQKCKGPNEYYNPCAPICSPQSCQSLVGPRPQCLPISPGECFGACRCIEGYFRNSEGVCIPKDQCELCTRKNEEYNECAPRCRSETCAGLYEKPRKCRPQIQMCEPACTCRKGFYRNDEGDCVPKDDCPCKIGERFPSDDGCNTCFCGNGIRKSSACTLRACVKAGPVVT